jgi:vacuolar protein sorting-associated protein 13D
MIPGSLSDGLGWVALDETHEEIRQKILKKNPQQSSSFQHLKVGFRSFAFGVLGGATSIFTQTYEGIAMDGPPVSCALIV